MTTTRKGDNKKGAQKYKNVTAFKHNKNSKLTKKILSMPVNGLCQRCFDIIQWRKTYRKYKPLTQAKKCPDCDEKSVKEAYHVLCQACAQKKDVCAKCLQSKEIVEDLSQIDTDKEVEKLKELCLSSNLPERKKRTYLRRLERDGLEGVAGLSLEAADGNDSDLESDLSSDDEDDQ
ncbi:hypothetical protein MP228_007327 [Amoeboaphelidium protococcarum]|nr:hypothetical protein MP228_007327 [Amoeboaphelidium protococcarum]